jgi:5-methylthioadenosine/S-adenosylhomocysteine deaminase
MIRSGTTCFISHQNARFIEEALEATVRAGLRGVFARILVDDPQVPDNLRETPLQAIRNTLELHKRYRAKSKARVMFGPMGLHNCSFELMREVAKANQDHNLGIHTHCSETRETTEKIKRSYGASEIEVLNKTGVLTRRTLLVHCNYISDDDIRIIRRAGSSVVHCPSSSNINRSLRSLPSNFIGRGINVALGSDGPNACHNLFLELRRCALLNRSLSPIDCLQMVTINAAKSLGMEAEIGSLESGKKADLVIVEPQEGKGSLSNLLTSIEGSRVTDVMIDGRFIMHNGNILTCDEQQIMCDASSYIKKSFVGLCS